MIYVSTIINKLMKNFKNLYKILFNVMRIRVNIFLNNIMKY